MGPGGHPARSADLARGGRPTCAWPLLGWALAGGSPSGSTSLVQVHLALVVLDFDEIWPFVLELYSRGERCCVEVLIRRLGA